MALGSCYIFFFQTHFRSVKFKGLPAGDDASNSERTSYQYFENKYIEHLPNGFTSVTCAFHFWIGSQSEGITFTIQFSQVQLDWSRRNLSLPIEHHFWIRFRQSAELLSFVLCNSQGFRYFARSRSREFQVNPRNPAKFTKTGEIPRNSLEILPNTCRHNIFEIYLGCWGCLLAVNLLIYPETSSPQRVNNIPKLPGVIRLMLRKTGKKRRKNPGVLGVSSVDRGNWGWECNSLFLSCARSSRRMLRFVKDYPLYVHLTYKDDDIFRKGSVHEW